MPTPKTAPAVESGPSRDDAMNAALKVALDALTEGTNPGVDDFVDINLAERAAHVYATLKGAVQ